MSDRLGRMLVHPLRRRVLLEYHDGVTNPGEVARRLGQPLNLVSYHTGVLLRHGCLEVVRTERRHGAVTTFYRSTVAPVIEDREWTAISAQLQRALTHGTLDQAADEAQQAALEGGFDAAEAHLSRSLLELDEQGVLEVARCLRATLADIARIGAQARARAGATTAAFEVVLMGFESARRASAVTGPPPPASSPPLPDRPWA